jgi:hypothetical protein
MAVEFSAPTVHGVTKIVIEKEWQECEVIGGYWKCQLLFYGKDKFDTKRVTAFAIGSGDRAQDLEIEYGQLHQQSSLQKAGTAVGKGQSSGLGTYKGVQVVPR